MKFKRPAFKEILSTTLMLAGILAFRSSLAEPYVVPTGSMEPTILPGDRLLVDKAAYDLKIPFLGQSLLHYREPARGDVVVFRYPPDPSIFYVKRLIGLPGDIVEVDDGRLVINGNPVSVTPEVRAGARVSYRETLGSVRYTVQRLPERDLQPGSQRFVVPQGSYFFMGDNRDNSSDSRFWGFVPAANIQGKAVAIWLSVDPKSGIIPEVRMDRIGQRL